MIRIASVGASVILEAVFVVTGRTPPSRPVRSGRSVAETHRGGRCPGWRLPADRKQGRRRFSFDPRRSRDPRRGGGAGTLARGQYGQPLAQRLGISLPRPEGTCRLRAWFRLTIV